MFLSSDPVRWAYQGVEHRVARVEVRCNPCPHLDCPIDFRCANRLSISDVLAHVHDQLR